MRYPIPISKMLKPLFSVFGFRSAASFVELTDQEIEFSFGTAKERVPLSNVEGASRCAWPIYYGLGAKYGPDDGVAYVGARAEVVQVRFKSPVLMNIWGPFRKSGARCATFNVENAEAFIKDVEAKLHS